MRSATTEGGSAGELRRWAESWEQTGEFQGEVKRQGLARMDDAAAQHSIRLLSSDERLWFDPKAVSVLVEPQRLFQNLASR
ncbi:MAG: hypothetical protein J0L84_02030 [Verrucomicrobia bacterium]|nr:hypothetical protein [Verrucomicrobiota bacterium]